VLYRRVIDPASWTPYPDTVDVLHRLSGRRIRTCVVSNIPSTCARRSRRPVRADDYVLSFEVGGQAES
jgi:FMN phosphatase YigB (HAD superfamily)